MKKKMFGTVLLVSVISLAMAGVARADFDPPVTQELHREVAKGYVVADAVRLTGRGFEVSFRTESTPPANIQNYGGDGRTTLSDHGDGFFLSDHGDGPFKAPAGGMIRHQPRGYQAGKVARHLPHGSSASFQEVSGLGFVELDDGWNLAVPGPRRTHNGFESGDVSAFLLDYDGPGLQDYGDGMDGV